MIVIFDFDKTLFQPDEKIYEDTVKCIYTKLLKELFPEFVLRTTEKLLEKLLLRNNLSYKLAYKLAEEIIKYQPSEYLKYLFLWLVNRCVIENYCKADFEREKLRNKEILSKLESKYGKITGIYIITANPGAFKFVVNVLPDDYKHSIKGINFVNLFSYIKNKAETISKIKENTKERIIYIADMPEDEKVAKKANVEFLSIFNV